MIRLKDNPRFSLVFSLLLLLLTYGAEGWIYGSWVFELIEQETILARYVESTQISILYGSALIGIMFLVVLFTSPVSLMTVVLNR